MKQFNDITENKSITDDCLITPWFSHEGKPFVVVETPCYEENKTSQSILSKYFIISRKQFQIVNSTENTKSWDNISNKR